MNKRTLSVTLPVCAVIVAAGVWLAKAGDLNPPAGPISPTMKTLTEVEPRRPIETLSGAADAVYLISQPGSYYFTGDIAGEAAKHGIKIDADNVTLDLRGFALIGVDGSWDGISQDFSTTRYNVRIHNGTIRDWGWDGIDLIMTDNSQLQDLRLYDNDGHGFRIGNNSLVSGCTALDNYFGFECGQGCRVAGCTARSNLNVGFYVANGSIITGCTMNNNGIAGISLTGGDCTIKDNVCNDNGAYGITVIDNSFVIGNTCKSNGTSGNLDSGIYVSQDNNRIEGNNVVENNIGIRINHEGNLIVRNSASDNPNGNYVIAPGNKVGTITGDPTTAGPWDNFEF